MGSYGHVYRPPHRVVHRPSVLPPPPPPVYPLALDGGLSFASIDVFVGNKRVIAIESFVGALPRVTNSSKPKGILSFAGLALKGDVKSLLGLLSFVSILGITSVVVRAYSGTLSFVGTLPRSISRTIQGVLSFAGNVPRFVARSFLSTLSFVGTPLKLALSKRSGILTFAGTLKKLDNKILNGLLTFTGTVTRAANQRLFSSLSFFSLVIRSTSRKLLGSLSFVGNITYPSALTFSASGSLSSVGNITKYTTKKLLGVLSFVGVLSALAGLSVTLSGVISFVGTTIKRSSRVILGTLQTVGAPFKRAAWGLCGQIRPTSLLSFQGGLTKIISGILSFVGVARKSIDRRFLASLSFFGSVKKLDSRLLSGTLAFVGAIKEGVSRLLNGVLSFVGTLTTQAGVSYSIVGVVSFIGAMFKTPARRFTAIFQSLGLLTQQTQATRNGILTFFGTFPGQLFSKVSQGALSFSSTVAGVTNTVFHLLGSLNPFGVIFKQNYKTIRGILDVLGSIGGENQTKFLGTLSFEGIERNTLISTLLVGTFSFASTILLTAHKMTRGVLSFVGACLPAFAGVPTIIKIDAFLSEMVATASTIFETTLTKIATKFEILKIQEVVAVPIVYEESVTRIELRTEVIAHNILEETRD